MAKLLIKWLQVVMLASSLVFTTSSWAAADDTGASDERERPGYAAALGDVVFVRPLTLLATVIGSVIFVVTLPVTAATGTIGEAGMTLVADPAMDTFARCLGCTEVGWRKLPKKELSDQ